MNTSISTDEIKNYTSIIEKLPDFKFTEIILKIEK
jgi:hypothetical protein